MTSPIPEGPPLTPENQKILEELLTTLEGWRESNYYPALGWTFLHLSSDVRELLEKARTSSQPGHTHTTTDIDGLDDLIQSRTEGFASKTHRHSITDIDGVSESNTPSTLVKRTSTGHIPVASPTQTTHPVPLSLLTDRLATKAQRVHSHTISETTGLQDVLDKKASLTHTHSVNDIVGLREAISSAFDVSGKADLVGGVVPISQLPVIPISKVTNLSGILSLKADLTSGVVPITQIPDIPESKVTGYSQFKKTTEDTFKTTPKLVNGVVPETQLPRRALTDLVVVADKSGLLKLTPTEVQPGDIAVIKTGSDLGTYHLVSEDPSKESSWVKYVSEGGVASVNGKTGAVTLTALDVQARPSGNIPISDVTGLQSALDGKVSTQNNYVTKDQLPDTTKYLDQAYTFPPVDYVATERISTVGRQSVDGVLVPIGATVLLTNQASSSQNGVWVVSSSTWYRVVTMSDGSYVPPGSLVPVKSGTSHNNSLWQSGNKTRVLVNTDALSWSKVLGGGSGTGIVNTGDGLQQSGGVLSVKAGPGINVTSSGVSLDTSGLMRKYASDVPSGNTLATVTHNLNTKDVYVSVVEVSTGDIVLVGVTVSSVNSVSLEFASAPSAGQYRAVVFG